MKFKPIALILLRRVLPFVVGLAVLILVIVWLAGVLVDKIEPGRQEISLRRRSANDQVAQVKAVIKPVFEVAVGTIKASSRTAISSRVLARIERMHVVAGQTVAKGDPLIELDRRAVETQLRQAEASLVAARAALTQAESDYQRDVELLRRNVGSQQRLDQSTANREVALANVNVAKQAVTQIEVMLTYTEIKAPMSGLIADRWADEGDTARPGVPLLVMYDPKSLRLEVPVAENLAFKLKPGDEVNISIDAIGRNVRAPVDEIVPQAEAASRSLLVKIAMPASQELFEGMAGHVSIPAGSRRHLCLPTTAIRTVGQLEFVDLVRDDDSLERRLITRGRFGDPGHVEVLSGLKVGDRVLTGNTDGSEE